MKFEFQLKFKDYFRYYISHSFYSLTMQAMVVLTAVFIAIFNLPGGVLSKTFGAVFVYGFIWIFQGVLSIIYVAVGKNKTVCTKYVLSLSEAGIDSETTYSKSHVSWRGVLKVVPRGNSVAIYTQANAALLIPKRIIGDKRRCLEVISAIRTMKANA